MEQTTITQINTVKTNLDDPNIPPNNTVEGMLHNLTMINQVGQLALAGDAQKLEELGFDPELLPVMQLMAEKGPKILGTYAHPGEFDLYKIAAAVKLTETCFAGNIPLELITVFQLDTKAIDFTSQKPLAMGPLGPDKNQDILNVENPPIPTKELERKVIETAKLFMSQLDSDLNKTLISLTNELALNGDTKKQLKLQIFSTLYERLTTLMAIKPNFDSAIDSRTIQKQMADFNLAFAGILLEGLPNKELYIQNLGTKALFEALDYRKTIVQAVKMTVQIKGIDTLKQLLRPGSEDSLLSINLGEDLFNLRLNPDNRFILKQVSKYAKERQEIIIDDSQVLNFLDFGLPLGKLEAFALIAGGQTLHFGSGHGAEQKAAEILGLKGQALNYVVNLRFGEDSTQGHGGLKVGKKSVPLPLQYVMLGATGVQDLIANGPKNLQEISELREFFAKKLVLEAYESLTSQSEM